MIAELELEIIAAIQASAIAPYLRGIDALPDLTTDTTLNMVTASAPAVYVVAGDFKIADYITTVSFELLCLARNARGVNAARRGDGTTIGLYQIMEGMKDRFTSLSTTSTIWNAQTGSFLRAAAWTAAGISAGKVIISGELIDEPIDETVVANLSDFVTFNSDYDIELFVSADEHAKWLHEPADHSTSSPKLTDITTLLQ